mgnify:CR=1 FL=1
MELNNNLGASTSLNGKTEDEDGIILMMRKFNIPLTRENYLDLAYMGDIPEELSAEELADIPEMFQIQE